MRTARFNGHLYRELCVREGGFACLGCVCPGGVLDTSQTQRQTPHPLWDWLRDKCKSITLHQTSFARSNHTETGLSLALVHKHVKISVGKWLLETTRPHKHVKNCRKYWDDDDDSDYKSDFDSEEEETNDFYVLQCLSKYSL